MIDSTTFIIPNETHDQFMELSDWINKHALLRELLGDADKIKLKAYKRKRRYDDSRLSEVTNILKNALPGILKQCERIEGIIDPY